MRRTILLMLLISSCLFYACEDITPVSAPAVQAVSQGTDNFREISSNLLSRYTAPGDSLKKRAAEYLLAGLPLQWHYDVNQLEESGNKVKVLDLKVIDADYLAENIDYAFRAWSLPW